MKIRIYYSASQWRKEGLKLGYAHQLRAASNMDELVRFAGAVGVGRDGLRAAPIIQHGDLMNARNRASRRAAFLCFVLALAPLRRILVERDPRISALLGAVMNQAVLADIQVAGARPAAPIVFASSGDIVLEGIDSRKGAFPESHDLLENFSFMCIKWSQLTIAVMDDANGRRKTKIHSALRDSQSIVRMRNAAAQNRIDVDVKIGVLCEKLQLLIENLQALFGYVIRLNVIDADLQEFETRTIESVDTIGRQKIPIGDYSGDHAIVADTANNVVEIRMKKRLASADGDHRSSKRAQAIDTPKHFLEQDRFREIVKFVAVCTGKIAPAHRNDMREQGVLGGEQCFGDHVPAAHRAMRRKQPAFEFPANVHWYVCEARHLPQTRHLLC